jgi:NADPH2:quinone reductase
LKAIVITRTGGPEVLELREIPDPVIQKDTEVLVKIKAAGVNPIDTKLRKGETYYPVKIPMIPGFDGAGIIEEIGSKMWVQKIETSSALKTVAVSLMKIA